MGNGGSLGFLAGFLAGYQIGRMMTIGPPREEGGDGDAEEGRAVRACPRLYFCLPSCYLSVYFVSFLFSLSFCLSLFSLSFCLFPLSCSILSGRIRRSPTVCRQNMDIFRKSTPPSGRDNHTNRNHSRQQRGAPLCCATIVRTFQSAAGIALKSTRYGRRYTPLTNREKTQSRIVLLAVVVAVITVALQ